MSETYHNFLHQQEQKVLEARKRKWENIKRELPLFADFIIEINKQMGKPAFVEIEVYRK